MILQIHSDGLYLFIPKARSRIGETLFISGKKLNHANWKWNGSIDVIAKILKNFMGSVAEAKIEAIYINAQDAVPSKHL